MKITDWMRYTLLGSAISIQLVISLLMLPIDHIERAIGQVEEATTIFDVDFDSPQDNTLNLGTPFLVQYDNTNSLSNNTNIILDNGAMFFDPSSSNRGELLFLNNKVGIYKDMIDLNRGNLTTIAWEWK